MTRLILAAVAGALLGFILRGWQTEPLAVVSRYDAWAVCVAGTLTTNASILSVPLCARKLHWAAQVHRSFERTIELHKEVEKGIQRMNKALEDLRPFMDHPSPLQGASRSQSVRR